MAIMRRLNNIMKGKQNFSRTLVNSQGSIAKDNKKQQQMFVSETALKRCFMPNQKQKLSQEKINRKFTILFTLVSTSTSHRAASPDSGNLFIYGSNLCYFLTLPRGYPVPRPTKFPWLLWALWFSLLVHGARPAPCHMPVRECESQNHRKHSI